MGSWVRFPWAALLIKEHPRYMSNVSLFHGTGSSPNDFWIPWLKKELEQGSHKVWAPQLPNADTPRLKEWLPFCLSNRDFFDIEDSILVGHSAGCPLILSLLERIEVKVKKVILVAGFAQPLNSNDPEEILPATFNWGKIRSFADSFVIINSDNDPWGCDDGAGKYIFDHVGGTLIVRHGEGHMGSKKFNQPYREFPLLLELITNPSF